MQEHLHRYGHTIYNLDFANPVPADNPAPLLETLKLYLNGQGTNPYVRQQASIERREQAARLLTRRLKGWRLNGFNTYLARAQRYAPLREDGLADIGLAYPLMRKMLIEIGHRLVRGGLMAGAEDIFWLTQEEVQQGAAALDAGQALDNLSAAILLRKSSWKLARQITPPVMLPQMKLFGRDLRQLKNRRPRGRSGKTIRGVACSPGSVTAPANVIRGLEDFSHMRPGDILVAAITTPAWTPLFAMASGIVTDVGGPLSHGSIVAREYGIPAVLGTGIATRSIRSGQTIRVDGSTGEVELIPA
jgi:pyruvate,water dikinase